MALAICCNKQQQQHCRCRLLSVNLKSHNLHFAVMLLLILLPSNERVVVVAGTGGDSLVLRSTSSSRTIEIKIFLISFSVHNQKPHAEGGAEGLAVAEKLFLILRFIPFQKFIAFSNEHKN